MSEQTNLSTPPGKGQLERDAAEWCVRMHGDEAEHHHEAFEQWLRRGALHRQAYNRIEEVYLLGSRVRRERVMPSTRSDPAKPLRAPKTKGVLAATSLAVAAVALGIVIINGTPISRPKARPSMADEQRDATRIETAASPQLVQLADGSRVSLAPASTLLVSFTGLSRQLSLVSGRARFAVAHEYRPFTVAAGGGLITATGTLFEVTAGDEAVDVRLIEGRIEVTAPVTRGSSVASLRHLVAGERLRFSRADAGEQTTGASSDRQPETVGTLVAVANRMGDGGLRIELADTDIAATRLSGVFQAHEPAVTAARLAEMLDLAIDRSRSGVLRLVRKPRR